MPKNASIPNTITSDLKLKDDKGNSVNLSDLNKTNGLVIFAYPRAITPGCTKQVCVFRDSYDDFVAKGYKVFGLSNDKSSLNAEFSNLHRIPYPLISDNDEKLIKLLGINNRGQGAKRSAFVIPQGSDKIHTAIDVSPEESKEWAWNFISKL